MKALIVPWRIIVKLTSKWKQTWLMTTWDRSSHLCLSFCFLPPLFSAKRERISVFTGSSKSFPFSYFHKPFVHSIGPLVRSFPSYPLSPFILVGAKKNHVKTGVYCYHLSQLCANYTERDFPARTNEHNTDDNKIYLVWVLWCLTLIIALLVPQPQSKGGESNTCFIFPCKAFHVAWHKNTFVRL